MTRRAIDSKGRITVPKNDRDEWGATPGDQVQVRIHTGGQAEAIHGELDSKGRVTIPKPKRNSLKIGSTDRVSVELIGVKDNKYECDDCGETFDLEKVIILDAGERIVCGNCVTTEDRIIS